MIYTCDSIVSYICSHVISNFTVLLDFLVKAMVSRLKADISYLQLRIVLSKYINIFPPNIHQKTQLNISVYFRNAGAAIFGAKF